MPLLRACLVLCLLALGAPAPAAVFNPETFTLDNGLEVVVVPMRRVPVVSHMVWYRAGAADEPPGKSGIAHFLEHLMFKGTPTVPAGEFSKTVKRLGGQDNAFTSWDYTAYFQNIAVDRLEEVMQLEADRMANLQLSDEVVYPERDVILEERGQVVENNPAALLGEQTNAALFLNHPYGIPIIGWRHEMATLSRADAEAWYRRYYRPNNAILIVAGDIDAATLKPMVERTYGRVARGEDLPLRTRPQEPPPLAARTVVLRHPEARQPTVSREWLAPTATTPEGSQHYYPLQILTDILGDGRTSRLWRSLVVEQKLATTAGAWYDIPRLDMSSITLYAVPRPDVTPERLAEALQAEIDRLLAEGVTAEEVATQQRQMLAEAVYARDSLYWPARVFGQALTTGMSVADVEAWPERIAAVTEADVEAAAAAVFAGREPVTGILLPAAASAAAAE